MPGTNDPTFTTTYESVFADIENIEPRPSHYIAYLGDGGVQEVTYTGENEMPHTMIWPPTITRDTVGNREDAFINHHSRFFENYISRRPRIPEETISTLREMKERIDSSSAIDFITLAGGAPRDLYLRFEEGRSKDVKDYDIFVKSDAPAIRAALIATGFTRIMRVDDQEYENDEDNPDHFKAIYEAKFGDLEVNVMLVEDNESTAQGIIDNFACSLSKFELNLDNMEVTAHKEALLSIASNTLIFKEGVRGSYKEKICGYFSDYSVGSYQEAVFKLLDIELNSMTKSIEIG